jgi:hypothetical protein
VNHDDTGRDVEQQDRWNPVHDMRRAKFSRRSQPLNPNDIKRLRENKVYQA